jgi:O-antigen ligase
MSQQSVALVLLLIGVSLEQPAFEVAGLTIKPELIALIIVWAFFGWRLIQLRSSSSGASSSGALSIGRLGGGRLLLWTIPYLVALLAASILNAPDTAAGLRHTLLVALVASAAWLVLGLVDTPVRLALAVRSLVGLTLAEAALTFVVLAFAWSWVPPGAQLGAGGIAVPNGTLWEPNLLGSYLAAGAVLALATLLVTASRQWATGLACGFALILAALGLSLARGAWLGFAAGVLVLGVGQVALRARGVQPPGATRPYYARNILLALLAAALAGLFLAGIAPVVFPGTAAGFSSRVNLSTYNPQTDPSVRSRADALQQAYPRILAHPILGNGAGSFGASYEDARGNSGWIANLELHILYDSGLIGLGCWLVGLGGLIWSVGRRLRRAAGTPPALQQMTLALLAALASLLVAFQATEGSWLAFPWVYIGLLACAVRFARITNYELRITNESGSRNS